MTTNIAQGDLGTEELRKHHAVVIETREISKGGHEVARGARIRDQIPLDRYALRLELDRDAETNSILREAGLRFRQDFERAGIRPKVCPPSGPKMPSGYRALNESESAASAREKIKLALRYVGPDLADLVVHVCGLDEPASSWCGPHGGGAANIVLLRHTLRLLAYHYGLLEPPAASGADIFR